MVASVLSLPLAALVSALLASQESVAAAYARGDLDEVARQGSMLGAAGLGAMLGGPTAPAAIAAAPDAPDAWELLADLAAVAGSWDRSRAAPAARAAARIARRLRPDDAVRGDLPDDALAMRANAWLALARRRDRWADVRVHALEVAARVADTRRATADRAGAGFDLAAFLADPDPEVRRAACELTPVPVPPDLHAALATALADDAEPAVAIAAAQALCGDLADRRDPRPVLDALGNRGIARLRALLGEAPLVDVPAPALVDAARCLRADAAPESLAALRALVARAPAPARALLSRPLR